MENLIKKLEEQIAFLQHEISQMSDELYSQQKEVSILKKQISNFEKRIYDLENGNETGIVIEDKSNFEKPISHEFKTNEIFKASDLMVDSLTSLLDKERKKKTN